MKTKSNFQIEELSKEFQKMIEYVTDENSMTRTAYEVESNLFQNLLKMGNDLLTLFFSQDRGTSL